MPKLSEKSALKYYNNILTYHRMENSLITKVPSLKNELENGILSELTGIKHFKPKYENGEIVEDGQIKWLIENKIKRDRYGNIESGFIKAEVVNGIISVCPQSRLLCGQNLYLLPFCTKTVHKYLF